MFISNQFLLLKKKGPGLTRVVRMFLSINVISNSLLPTDISGGVGVDDPGLTEPIETRGRSHSVRPSVREHQPIPNLHLGQHEILSD
jgi:hypothetical protein